MCLEIAEANAMSKRAEFSASRKSSSFKKSRSETVDAEDFNQQSNKNYNPNLINELFEAETVQKVKKVSSKLLDNIDLLLGFGQATSDV